ncbi:MAG: ATP-binding protein [Deltaproteobacteria bacterium]|nr:ATP-binding protein [Deltaproteobacteria bacterium]
MRSLKDILSQLLEIPDEGTTPERYRIVRRNIAVLMLMITLIPLAMMTVINFYEYRAALRNEILTPMKALVNKAKHSFELFLASRLSTVNFIASAYTYDELADEKNLNRIFKVLKKEFEGFVDLGLIDSKGTQISYAGPYELQGKNYALQTWFEQVKVNGVHISDVFKGYRKFPHVAIAVQHISDSGKVWIVRATINTAKFDDLISSMGLDAESDAFLINRHGVFQTKSKFYGEVLDQCPVVPTKSFEPTVIEKIDPLGRDVFLSYAYFNQTDLVFMLIKPRSQVMKAWYTLSADLLMVLVIGVIVIIVVVLKLTGLMIQRMKESDDKRALALREVEHTHKLSSIGRLAAGVAHEVNNPLAVINEKAGLMKDVIEFTPDFPDKDRFLNLVRAIIQSVERCRSITHRLLGFARRMDVEVQVLDVNDVIKETLGFLEKEALYKNIQINLELPPDLPKIASDRGQLQQVFLNILNNALAAMGDGGTVAISSFERDSQMIGVTIRDTGHGMSEETLKHVFEPFFTTKKAGQGTGLGLSITYGIVKRLGGDIEVQSRVGRGTRFTVYLPKKTESEPGT